MVEITIIYFMHVKIMGIPHDDPKYSLEIFSGNIL